MLTFWVAGFFSTFFSAVAAFGFAATFLAGAAALGLAGAFAVFSAAGLVVLALAGAVFTGFSTLGVAAFFVFFSFGVASDMFSSRLARVGTLLKAPNFSPIPPKNEGISSIFAKN